MLLTDSLQTLRPLVEVERHRSRSPIEAGLPKVIADRERIQQALSNLVGNAISSPQGDRRSRSLDGAHRWRDHLSVDNGKECR